MARGRKSKTGGGARKIGRKKRKLAFQRYKASGRFLRKLRRHVHRNPNDRSAGSALEARQNAGSWVRWREAEKQRRMAR